MSNLVLEIREYPSEKEVSIDDLTDIGLRDVISQLKELEYDLSELLRKHEVEE